MINFSTRSGSKCFKEALIIELKHHIRWIWEGMWVQRGWVGGRREDSPWNGGELEGKKCKVEGERVKSKSWRKCEQRHEALQRPDNTGWGAVFKTLRTMGFSICALLSAWEGWLSQHCHLHQNFPALPQLCQDVCQAQCRNHRHWKWDR